jgi:hypothetical protein
MGARTRRIAPLAASVAALALSACGSDDFKNDPRPPAPIALSARISDQEVIVSPNSPKNVGAGLATITISNQTADPTKLVLEGPTDETSAEIVPQGTGDMRLNLEQGDYTVSASDTSARDTKLVVGPERKSSQNDLLLP